MARGISRARKKRLRSRVDFAYARIKATFNNTLLTIIDKEGNVLTWESGGSQGYRGSKKSTPFAARLAAEQCVEFMEEIGVKSMEITYKGPGPGREPAIRTFKNSSIKLVGIKDETPRPYNGCKTKKQN
ncbi:MAG: 30S ribosomal protein S11 [Candidatus Mcinerneyibacterium aminivorans]|uniref:Small ribosomal subunit protein uS11 n=1 Tax=Candidatus Mcinerneyibacterium aminivorans TaxID=2703815 RepID=A0A5D0MJD5_9BACT|nr:MAG: 30S ribosomal protein S11 [Candidatus Mcinerneyibacterium aminivorans]